jgi:endo-1,4-beta-xylanase
MPAKIPLSKRTAYIYPNLPFIIAVFLLICSSAWLTAHNRPAAQVNQQGREIKSQANLLDGQWSYMPGSAKQKDGLRITSTGLAIVEQDGTGGQPNPPINLFGTHLEQADDFRVVASLKDVSGKATLQLYSQPPIIADEFRIERGSIQLTLQGTTLKVAIWDGTKQQPVVSQSVTFSPAKGQDVISVRHENSKLYVSINGRVVTSVADYGLFDDGKVWFGTDATESWTLGKLEAMPVGNGILAVKDSSTLRITPKEDSSVQKLASAKRHDFNFGAAMALGPLVSDSGYANVALGGNFGALTTENALKWQFVHPKPNLYTFDEADAMVALAKKNGLSVHGHTLVFGEANPGWVQDLPTVSAQDKNAVAQAMTSHINTVVGHFKGSIASWDVVNEPLADYDNFDPEDGKVLRNNKWHQALGEAYIGEAFRAAHAADPDAKLFMNEYGLEEDGERWTAFVALLKRLKAQGVPIDGVGFQAHVYHESDRISSNTLRKHIRELARLGFISRISENDVYAYGGETNQAEQYARIFETCFAEPSCVSYTTWGVSDKYNVYRDDDGHIAYGEDFLWTRTMQPTQAITRIQSLLKD